MPKLRASYHTRVFSHRYGPFTGVKDGKASLIRDEAFVSESDNFSCSRSILKTRDGITDENVVAFGEIHSAFFNGTSLILADGTNLRLQVNNG